MKAEWNILLQSQKCFVEMEVACTCFPVVFIITASCGLRNSGSSISFTLYCHSSPKTFFTFLYSSLQRWRCQYLAYFSG